MKVNCFDNTVSPRWQASQGMKAIDFPPGEEIDRMVAQAMLELSAEEREKALEEIHGVVEVDEEDPDFMASCLDELDNCLAARKTGTAYELAEQMDYDYVSNNRFRTMFLRSTRYVPQDAAEKLIGFLDYKREMFGVEKLVHDITLDDLSPDDRALMEVGYVQFGKTHDRNGRPILCTCEKIKVQYSKSTENSVRDDDIPIPTYLIEYNIICTCPLWNPKKHRKRALFSLFTMSIARELPNPMRHDCDRYCPSDMAAFTFASMTNGNTKACICQYDPWDLMHDRGFESILDPMGNVWKSLQPLAYPKELCQYNLMGLFC
eukprot:scaffold4282_cov112-Cylindrotheca_fusiformis.AAC.9